MYIGANDWAEVTEYDAEGTAKGKKFKKKKKTDLAATGVCLHMTV